MSAIANRSSDEYIFSERVAGWRRDEANDSFHYIQNTTTTENTHTYICPGKPTTTQKQRKQNNKYYALGSVPRSLVNVMKLKFGNQGKNTSPSCVFLLSFNIPHIHPYRFAPSVWSSHRHATTTARGNTCDHFF